MAKVEVLFQGGAHRVEITYREPFEDIFEIAVHAGRFAHPRDAHRLAERVRKAVREAYPKSPATALGASQWIYRSSAYRSLADMSAANPSEYDVPASDAAKAADEAYDRAY